MSKIFSVWIPTGEMQRYDIEAETAEEARQKILDDDFFWENEPLESFFADVSSADWEIEGPYEE